MATTLSRTYTHRTLSSEQIIEMLKTRGLTIADEAAAISFLKDVSYFRLAAYLRPMEADKATHQYKPTATFENAVALYRFDNSLRELVFRAIQHIEISLRTRMKSTWITNLTADPYRLYAALCCMIYWLNAIDSNNTFVVDFKALLKKYPMVDVSAMGFPENWEDEPLWK